MEIQGREREREMAEVGSEQVKKRRVRLRETVGRVRRVELAERRVGG